MSRRTIPTPHFQNEKSVKYWETLVSLLTTSSLTHTHLALSYQWDEYDSEAREIVRKELMEQEDKYPVHENPLGLYLLRFGLYRTLPSNMTKVSKLSASIIDLGKLSKCDENYQRLLVLSLNSRGVCYQRMGLVEDALADYNESLRLCESYAMALYNRGNLRMDQYNYLEAIDDYDKTIEIDINYDAAYVNRSLCCSYLGNRVQALRDSAIAAQICARDKLRYTNARTLLLSANDRTYPMLDS